MGGEAALLPWHFGVKLSAGRAPPSTHASNGDPMTSAGPSTPKADLLYRRLIDTAPDAMVVVGVDKRIRFVNLQTESMFGYQRNELIGESLDVLIPERFHRTHFRH